MPLRASEYTMPCCTYLYDADHKLHAGEETDEVIVQQPSVIQADQARAPSAVCIEPPSR